jgi:putative proteasome-type protease
MTYCVAMRLKDGMVFVSDTRTNAGVDHISTFRKLFYFQGENREITIQSAGNLATTQSVIAKIKADIESEL